MQLSKETMELYREKAPQLLDAVASGEAEFIMRRDPVSDYCVKFESGWCGIHRQYGSDFLGDACHFYPRVTRALNDHLVTTLVVSCPEAARLALYGEEPFGYGPRDATRQPFLLKNYLPEGMAAEAAIATHRKFLAEAEVEANRVERNLMRLLVVARALEVQPAGQWEAAANFYFGIADTRLVAPEADARDLIHLVQGLMGLIYASKAHARDGLMAIAQRMEALLGIHVDRATSGLSLESDTMARGVKLLHHQQAIDAVLQPVLRRYLQAQIAQAMFPFSGLGRSAGERMTIIGVRLATLKLALTCASLDAGGSLGEDLVIQTVYTLSRFLDHLAEPELSWAIYTETGWVREARLRALLGDQ